MALSISGMTFWGDPARQLYVFPSGDVIHVLSSSDESVEEKHRAMVRKEDPKANGKGNAKAAEHSSTPPNAVKHNLLEKVDGVVGTIAEAKESLQISANFVQRQYTAEGLLHVANDTLKCAIYMPRYTDFTTRRVDVAPSDYIFNWFQITTLSVSDSVFVSHTDVSVGLTFHLKLRLIQVILL